MPRKSRTSKGPSATPGRSTTTSVDSSDSGILTTPGLGKFSEVLSERRIRAAEKAPAVFTANAIDTGRAQSHQFNASPVPSSSPASFRSASSFNGHPAAALIAAGLSTAANFMDPKPGVISRAALEGLYRSPKLGRHGEFANASTTVGDGLSSTGLAKSSGANWGPSKGTAVQRHVSAEAIFPAGTSSPRVSASVKTTTTLSSAAPEMPTPLSTSVLAFKRLMTLTDGRDKAMKLIQYAGKVLIWLWLHDKKRYPKLATRLAALVSTLSTTRKMIRMAHAVEPMAEFHDFLSGRTGPPSAKSHEYAKEFLLYQIAYANSFVATLNDLTDDVYTLAKIGVIDKAWAAPADKWSSRLWLAGILADVIAAANDLENVSAQLMNAETDASLREKSSDDETSASAKSLVKLRDKRFWLIISIAKLLMDGIFCSWDVFSIKGSDGWQACSGLASGVLAGYKLWHKTIASL